MYLGYELLQVSFGKGLAVVGAVGKQKESCFPITLSLSSLKPLVSIDVQPSQTESAT
jgi:hypothetical protein